MHAKSAAMYLRIWDDPEKGLSPGLTRQRQGCQKLAERLGWTIRGEYEDHDTADSSKRPRPGYEDMLVDLEAGRLDGILCWDVDRLTRKPSELAKIIDLADRRGIALASVGGELDLLTGVARLQGERKRRPAYGWRREDGRKVIDPAQAEIVEEIVDRILACESMAGIARDLQMRGVPPVRRQTWSRAMVRELALRESNAGLRVHRGEVVGPGNWDPIITQEKYEQVKSYLTNPARRISPTNNHRHLLSGIARCGRCGGVMRVMSSRRGRSYVCSECFGVRRAMEPVDEEVRNMVIALLSRADGRRTFMPPDDSHLYAESNNLRAKLDGAAIMYREDEIDGQQLYLITKPLRQRKAKIEAQIQRSAPNLSLLIQPDMVWNELLIERKRAIIALLMEVTILPAHARGVRFDGGTVKMVAKYGGETAESPPPHPPSSGETPPIS